MEVGIYGLIGVIVAGLMAYLASQAKQKAQPTAQGTFHLRLHIAYGIIGWACIVLGIGFFIGTIFSSEPYILEIGFVMMLFFGVLGGICVLWHSNHAVSFNQLQLRSSSWLNNYQTMEWKDVKSINYNAVSGMLIFTNARNEKVKAHMHLVGLGSLGDAIEENTTWKKSDLNIL